MKNLSNLANLNGLCKMSVLPAESFCIQQCTTSAFSPADSTTYYIGNVILGTGVTISQPRIYVQKRCVLRKAYILSTQTVVSSNENETLSIVVNETTEYTITSTFKHDQASVNVGNNTSLEIPLNEGDYFCIKRVTPARATNPAGVKFMMVFWCDCIPTAGTGSYLMQAGLGNITMTASTTYYLYDGNGGTNSSQARIYIPANGTITSAGVYARAGVLGSSEQFTYALRLNNTADYNITTTAKLDALTNTYSNESISIPVVAGDYVSLKLIGPAWVTAPTVSHRFSFVVTR